MFKWHSMKLFCRHEFGLCRREKVANLRRQLNLLGKHTNHCSRLIPQWTLNHLFIQMTNEIFGTFSIGFAVKKRVASMNSHSISFLFSWSIETDPLSFNLTCSIAKFKVHQDGQRSSGIDNNQYCFLSSFIEPITPEWISNHKVLIFHCFLF